jgi:Ser/Thr protein kinase RdoA (MazF antagonist)
MKLPPGDTSLDLTWLADAAERSPEWPHGAIKVKHAVRISTEYGLSGGAVYRVTADAERSGPVSFVVKMESAEATERALGFHRAIGLRVAGRVPECFGGVIDQEGDRGLLLLGDVSPAEQGDVLRGCTDVQAEAATRSLARVHAAFWNKTDDAAAPRLPRWSARSMEPGLWGERLSTAAERFPQILPSSLANRLEQTPARLVQAIESLEAGPTSWIHGDAHLDNVLFRQDGAAVLIDWSGAAVGPPAVDVARLFTEGLDAGAKPERARELLSAYAEELNANGITNVGTDELSRRLSDGLAVLLQSAVGWAGSDENREPLVRMRALQENLLRSACAWVLNDQVVSLNHAGLARSP